MTDQKCTKCQQTKTHASFSRSSCRSSGYYNRCKVCVSAEKKAWREANPDKDAARKRQYYEANRKRVIAKVTAQDKADPQRAAARKDAWAAANKGKVQASRKRHYLANRARLSFDHQIRKGVLRGVTMGGKGGKRTFAILGYSSAELRAHIEALFVDGMSWANYGSDWHLDHVVPLSVFNYYSVDHIDFHRAWSLNNLQPLWAKDNIIKSDKLNEPFQPSFAI